MITVSVLVPILFSAAAQAPDTSPVAGEQIDRWGLARRHADTLVFSTLFTAQEVRDLLTSSQAIQQAIDWCRQTAVTRVYIETFRGGYTADRQTLLLAQRLFERAGLRVGGCVTTTGLGRKAVKGWFNCMTDPAARRNSRRSFAYTADLFDEIMIDDFFATDCQCDECVKVRGDRSWSRFRCDIMMEVSRESVLAPARRARPDVKVIFKYPQWYDQFHERGYDVARQPAIFDQIWAGTETRDPDSERWGRKSQYEAYFMMRWLGRIGGPKCGGGWFDSHDTAPDVYLEQARQSVLGGAREIVLFSYGSLQGAEGTADVQALRGELPLLFELARIVRGRPPRGVAAPKPPNSNAGPGHAGTAFWDTGPDEYIFDFMGLLGLPLVPDTQVRTDVPAAFLSYHALSDPELKSRLRAMLKAGTPLLMTDTLARTLAWPDATEKNGLMTIKVPSDAWSLMDLPADRLAAIRDKMLEPFGIQLEAPTRVALYLFGKDVVVLENFNNSHVKVGLAVKDAHPRSPVEHSPGPACVEGYTGYGNRHAAPFAHCPADPMNRRSRLQSSRGWDCRAAGAGPHSRASRSCNHSSCRVVEVESEHRQRRTRAK